MGNGVEDVGLVGQRGLLHSLFPQSAGRSLLSFLVVDAGQQVVSRRSRESLARQRKIVLGQPILIVAVAVLADHVEKDGSILLADGLDIGQTFLDVDPRAVFLSQSLIDAGQMMIQGNVPRNTWFIPFFMNSSPS